MGFSSRGALKTEDRELPLLLGRGRISLMRRSELVFSDLLAPAAAADAAAAAAFTWVVWYTTSSDTYAPLPFVFVGDLLGPNRLQWKCA